GGARLGWDGVSVGHWCRSVGLDEGRLRAPVGSRPGKGEAMSIDRRRLLAASGAAAVGSVLAGTAAGAAPGSRSASLFLADDGLAPSREDRLPLAWHQGRAKRLQEHLAERGLTGVLLSDPWNIVYFTGLFLTTTERPCHVFLPADRLAAIWFHPGIDRDLVSTWWATEAESYFDFPHGEGAFPNL